jgi:aldehyde dehydrogenase (NAD+)
VVLKPSEIAPLSVFTLFDLIDEAGFPAGVVNLVSGDGPTVGEAIASHPDVDLVSFTGSNGAGVRGAQVAAANVTRLSLELGGKSANVLLPDADLDKAVRIGIANCMINSGQTCTAWTRMIVPQELHGAVVEQAATVAAKYPTGDPFDDATRLGPLVSAAQRERVVGYIQSAVAEGATVAAGGSERPHERGHFVRPTVLSDVTPSMQVAQEEIFGPVLSVLSYSSEDEALDIANGTRYGLVGGVWSANPDRATAFARRMRTGQADINGGSFNPPLPSASSSTPATAANSDTTGSPSSCRPSRCNTKRHTMTMLWSI